MKTKILIAIGLVAAFMMGSVLSGYYSGASAANTPVQQSTVIPARVARPAAVRTQYVAPRPAALVETESPAVVTSEEKNRSWQKEALIVGGSAGAGAAIGAVAGGKKGAAIGAVSGGVAGLVYDMATRNKKK